MKEINFKAAKVKLNYLVETNKHLCNIQKYFRKYPLDRICLKKNHL